MIMITDIKYFFLSVYTSSRLLHARDPLFDHEK